MSSTTDSSVSYVGCILDCPQARAIEKLGLEDDDREDSKPEGSCTCSACVEHKDDPSSNVCGNCDCVLHDWVHIYCLVHTDGEEVSFCSDCWQTHRKDMKAEGWKDANAEDNGDGFSSDEDE